jgi:hypothetical protein
MIFANIVEWRVMAIHMRKLALFAGRRFDSL